MKRTPEIIVALDVQSITEAKRVVDAIGDQINFYKVGLESFVSFGHELIDFLKKNNKKIFLDLKFHDIPNTVAKALIAGTNLGVDMINLHTQGGFVMMKETVEKTSEHCAKINIKKPLIIGVTLLTSLDQSYFSEIGLSWENIIDYVKHLAKSAKKAGLDGVVSSARETVAIKDVCGRQFITVTPGIRPAFAQLNDQKRVVTPKDAFDMGTDFIVVGRPITKDKNPDNIVRLIKEEMR